MTRLAELVIAAEPQAWRDAGFAVDEEGGARSGSSGSASTRPVLSRAAARGRSPPRPMPR